MGHDHLLARHDFTSPNHSARGGHPVRALCIHTTAGHWPSDRAWLCDPDSQVSSHYIIGPDGTAWQLVDEAEAAWTQGRLNKPNLSIPVVAGWAATPQPPGLAGLPNLESVSIEVSAMTGMAWTAAQRVTVVSLGRDICGRLGISAAAVLRHADIDSVNRPFCPGLAVDAWKLLVRDIMGEPNNPWWDEIGEGLRAYIRQRGDLPAGPERFIHDPDRTNADGTPQNITSHVDGVQRAYTYHHDARRVSVRSYEPLAPPG